MTLYENIDEAKEHLVELLVEEELFFDHGSLEIPGFKIIPFRYNNTLYFGYLGATPNLRPQTLSEADHADAIPVLIQPDRLVCVRTGETIQPSFLELHPSWIVRPNLMSYYDLKELAVDVVQANLT